jgi:hypothetical protein
MNQEIIDYFSENIDDIIIISLIIIALMVIFSMLNIDFNSNKNKHIEKVVTIENLENKQEKNGTTFEKAFCEINKAEPHKLDASCNELNESNCNSTGCCVWINSKKCVAGDKKGPTFFGTESEPLKIEHYHYKNKLFKNSNKNSDK